jgi:hypothetical protein
LPPAPEIKSLAKDAQSLEIGVEGTIPIDPNDVLFSANSSMPDKFYLESSKIPTLKGPNFVDQGIYYKTRANFNQVYQEAKAAQDGDWFTANFLRGKAEGPKPDPMKPPLPIPGFSAPPRAPASAPPPAPASAPPPASASAFPPAPSSAFPPAPSSAPAPPSDPLSAVASASQSSLSTSMISSDEVMPEVVESKVEENKTTAPPAPSLPVVNNYYISEVLSNTGVAPQNTEETKALQDSLAQMRAELSVRKSIDIEEEKKFITEYVDQIFILTNGNIARIIEELYRWLSELYNNKKSFVAKKLVFQLLKYKDREQCGQIVYQLMLIYATKGFDVAVQAVDLIPDPQDLRQGDRPSNLPNPPNLLPSNKRKKILVDKSAKVFKQELTEEEQKMIIDLTNIKRKHIGMQDEQNKRQKISWNDWDWKYVDMPALEIDPNITYSDMPPLERVPPPSKRRKGDSKLKREKNKRYKTSWENRYDDMPALERDPTISYSKKRKSDQIERKGKRHKLSDWESIYDNMPALERDPDLSYSDQQIMPYDANQQLVLSQRQLNKEKFNAKESNALKVVFKQNSIPPSAFSEFVSILRAMAINEAVNYPNQLMQLQSREEQFAMMRRWISNIQEFLPLIFEFDDLHQKMIFSIYGALVDRLRAKILNNQFENQQRRGRPLMLDDSQQALLAPADRSQQAPLALLAPQPAPKAKRKRGPRRNDLDESNIIANPGHVGITTRNQPRVDYRKENRLPAIKYKTYGKGVGKHIHVMNGGGLSFKLDKRDRIISGRDDACFGIYGICKRKLKDGVFSVIRLKNRKKVNEYPNRQINNSLKSAVLELLQGVSPRLDSLSSEDAQFIRKFVERSKVNHIELPRVSTTDNKLIHQTGLAHELEVNLGHIHSGNTSKLLKEETLAIVDKLEKQKVFNNYQANEIIKTFQLK